MHLMQALREQAPSLALQRAAHDELARVQTEHQRTLTTVWDLLASGRQDAALQVVGRLIGMPTPEQCAAVDETGAVR